MIGALGKRPSPGGFSTEVDDFAIIPYGTYEKVYGKVLKGSAKISAGNFNPAVFRTGMIAVVPRVGMRDAAMQEVEGLMRARHRLKLDEPNDFDLATQDAVLKVWEQISQATFLALVVISSIALMVGGIGVMAIMMISVTERTREIGVRKALGARRREILWQFLIEAIFLTSTGRRARHHLRQLDRPAGPLALRLPGLAALVVVRASASASRPASASSSGCSPPSRPRGSIRSRRCGTSSLVGHAVRGRRLPSPSSRSHARHPAGRRNSMERRWIRRRHLAACAVARLGLWHRCWIRTSPWTRSAVVTVARAAACTPLGSVNELEYDSLLDQLTLTPIADRFGGLSHEGLRRSVSEKCGPRRP